MFTNKTKRTGFTLIEMIVVIGLLSLISVGIIAASSWGLRLWNITQEHIKAQDKARAVFQNIVGEIREMQISDNGSYPIESADGDTAVFFSNVDSDQKREKIKYELQGNTLYRWYAESDSATPPQYPAFSDSNRSIIATDIIGSPTIFEYFDDTYTGTSGPLPLPIQLNAVRLVKIHLLIDLSPGQSPAPFELQTSITLRNLKDNL